MAEHVSAEQVRATHLEILGPDLGPLYHALRDEIAALHVRWGQYRELFAHSPERIQLLNQAGAQFFRVVQDALWADILLSLARLTDRPGSGSSATLTIRALPKAIPDLAVGRSVAELAAAADTPFIRGVRNRRLAHRNRNISLGVAEPLPGISRQHVEEALAAIRAAMNRIAVHYLASQEHYELTIEGLGGASAVVSKLEFAVGIRHRYREHLKAGGAPVDFMHRGHADAQA